MAGLTLAAGMDAVSSTSTCTGVTDTQGKPVAMTEEYARSGFEPAAMTAACGAAGISADETRRGIGEIRLVGGTEHEGVAAANFVDTVGRQAAVDTHQAGAPQAGMAAEVSPKGRSH